ncbi:iron complex transport system ATP-binding protein [Actinoplanes lutulentus]|uniref:Iron complex transport system ATP-binding protein n=1 Tax=Actinoplanes lutulentus TaxID=1287878 RepID=A0A327Z409_9ACTN|nr:heme ABC transporter ATP-binding protein [Actinoplanes lutulentus]MBB2944636.1 iron complex transport system ATP-binding protein [Actinoplanes lutulentus]RAK27158.1 iron complex transport system ATP-binding protein [Actinoplanes lutulentus]
MRATGVSVRLGGREVVSGVDMHVDPGEVVALVGPNGAGKSTLLAALAGDIGYSGEIRIAGRDLTAYKAVELARQRSVLPQKATLSFPFNAGEVIRMGRAPWNGRPESADDEDAVAEAMKWTETSAFDQRPFPALSGGEQARVALARVLAQRTPVLLLDEPTAALDLRHQELVMAAARARAGDGAAVAVVLHDLGLAAAYADRAYVLAAGKVRRSGPPAEVFTEELLSEVYQHRVEVIDHPRTGTPLIVPHRS